MRTYGTTRRILGLTLTLALAIATAGTAAAFQSQSLAMASSKLTIAGSSNLHEWKASTADVRIKNAKLAINLTEPGFLSNVVKPSALEAFEISVPVNTLKSDKDGLDKNMYKALLAEKNPEIIFRATKLVAGATEGTIRATGMLKIAGVDKEVTFDIKTQLTGAVLSIKGVVPILMTDWGIAPPKAMMGMLKTDPKVSVSFEINLTVPPVAGF